MDLLHFKVYWPTMFVDTDHWLPQCEWCLVSKGDYTEPKTLQGSLAAHQPLELLCIDFTKANIMKGGKENILVLTDAFSKYSQVFVTSNQKSLTMPNSLWINGLVCLGYLQGSIVIKVGPLTMKSFLVFARCMALGKVQLWLIILMIILNANTLIGPYLGQ